MKRVFLVRVMVYLFESILSSAYLLVLHILACTDDLPDSHCISSLVLHILTRMAQVVTFLAVLRDTKSANCCHTAVYFQ